MSEGEKGEILGCICFSNIHTGNQGGGELHCLGGSSGLDFGLGLSLVESACSPSFLECLERSAACFEIMVSLFFAEMATSFCIVPRVPSAWPPSLKTTFSGSMTEARSSLKARCCWLPAASFLLFTGKPAQTGTLVSSWQNYTQLLCAFQRGHREEARDFQNRLSQRHQGAVQPKEAALLRCLWQQDQRRPGCPLIRRSHVSGRSASLLHFSFAGRICLPAGGSPRRSPLHSQPQRGAHPGEDQS